MSAPERLTERQREIVKQASETLGLTAAAIAAGARGVDMNSKEAVYWAAYSQTKEHLAGALSVIAWILSDAGVDTRMVGEVRAVLGGLDWDREDPQCVLKAIERIVGDAS